MSIVKKIFTITILAIGMLLMFFFGALFKTRQKYMSNEELTFVSIGWGIGFIFIILVWWRNKKDGGLKKLILIFSNIILS